jgi:hypothetical protein
LARGLERRVNLSNGNDLRAAYAGALEKLLSVVRLLAGLERADDHLLPGVGHASAYGEPERDNLQRDSGRARVGPKRRHDDVESFGGGR